MSFLFGMMDLSPCTAKHAVMPRKIVRSSALAYVTCRQCGDRILRKDVALWDDPMWECYPYCRECA